MKIYLALIAAIMLNSCASDLEVQDTSNRPPAPYSPDPTSLVPRVVEPDPLGAPPPGYGY